MRSDKSKKLKLENWKKREKKAIARRGEKVTGRNVSLGTSESICRRRGTRAARHIPRERNQREAHFKHPSHSADNPVPKKPLPHAESPIHSSQYQKFLARRATRGSIFRASKHRSQPPWPSFYQSSADSSLCFVAAVTLDIRWFRKSAAFFTVDSLVIRPWIFSFSFFFFFF